MKNLLLNLDAWRERLKTEPLALFLDYDGTLSAIAPTPEEATLPFATREILAALVKLRDVKVAIISGRALEVLKELVQVPGLSYVGSHGAEFSSPGITPKKISKRYYRLLQDLQQRISSRLGGMAGVLFEHKPVSFAVHYRKTSSPVERKAKRLILETCGDLVHQEQISIMQGKKVIEIMPPHAMNKGQATRLLLRAWGRNKYLPIFIGDDRTDEAAFEVLRDRGLTVRVGEEGNGSKAEYLVQDIGEVRLFLELILYLRFAGRPSAARNS
jgi:trehalose-phosphatase